MIYRTVFLGAFLTIAGVAMAQEVAPTPTPAPAPSPTASSTTVITRPKSLWSLGIGFGPLYGEAGTNIEYHITGQVSASAGIELDGDDTNDWFVGTSVYLRPEGKGSRPRITLGVGNGDWDNESDAKTDPGHRR